MYKLLRGSRVIKDLMKNIRFTCSKWRGGADLQEWVVLGLFLRRVVLTARRTNPQYGPLVVGQVMSPVLVRTLGSTPLYFSTNRNKLQ